jgi:hypothetical protein
MDRDFYTKLQRHLRNRRLDLVIKEYEKKPFLLHADDGQPTVDRARRSLMNVACEANYFDAVKWIAENGTTRKPEDWRKCFYTEYPHLVWAIRNANLWIAKFLVEHKVNVNEELTDKFILHSRKDNDLLFYKFDFLYGVTSRERPLDHALLLGENRIAEYLISKGAKSVFAHKQTNWNSNLVRVKRKLQLRPRGGTYGHISGDLGDQYDCTRPDAGLVLLIGRCPNQLTDKQLDFILYKDKRKGLYRTFNHSWLPLCKQLCPDRYQQEKAMVEEVNRWQKVRTKKADKDLTQLDPYLLDLIERNLYPLTDAEKQTLLYNDDGTPRRLAVTRFIPFIKKLLPHVELLHGTHLFPVECKFTDFFIHTQNPYDHRPITIDEFYEYQQKEATEENL